MYKYKIHVIRNFIPRLKVCFLKYMHHQEGNIIDKNKNKTSLYYTKGS